MLMSVRKRLGCDDIPITIVSKCDNELCSAEAFDRPQEEKRFCVETRVSLVTSQEEARMELNSPYLAHTTLPAVCLIMQIARVREGEGEKTRAPSRI
jgi:hypothetical protein